MRNNSKNNIKLDYKDDNNKVFNNKNNTFKK